jgi:hypothetical protein
VQRLAHVRAHLRFYPLSSANSNLGESASIMAPSVSLFLIIVLSTYINPGDSIAERKIDARIALDSLTMIYMKAYQSDNGVAIM